MLSKKELAALDLAALRSELTKARQELHRMRMEHGLRQLKDTSSVSAQRRYVARLLTFIRALELERPLTLSARPEKVRAPKAEAPASAVAKPKTTRKKAAPKTTDEA